MHHLVELQRITRREFLRGLEGLSDDDAVKTVAPMNCISWIVGHMASQEHVFFVAIPQNRGPEEAYGAFGFGSPATTPPLAETRALWRRATEEADQFLASTPDGQLAAPLERSRENMGTLLVRNIFHYWVHIGEISSIRQVLGHKPPDFVTLYGWQYGAQAPG